MHEPGLVMLAEAVEEHKTITTLSVGNQLAKLSTAAIGRLIDAQERTPSRIHRACNPYSCAFPLISLVRLRSRRRSARRR